MEIGKVGWEERGVFVCIPWIIVGAGAGEEGGECIYVLEMISFAGGDVEGEVGV